MLTHMVYKCRRPYNRLHLNCPIKPPEPPPPSLLRKTRCLFETFFTLDAEDSIKRRVLEHLIAVAHEAAPSQGLQSLGGALVRKATETGDLQAAFFLSLVPPTVRKNTCQIYHASFLAGEISACK